MLTKPRARMPGRRTHQDHHPHEGSTDPAWHSRLQAEMWHRRRSCVPSLAFSWLTPERPWRMLRPLASGEPTVAQDRDLTRCCKCISGQRTGEWQGHGSV